MRDGQKDRAGRKDRTGREEKTGRKDKNGRKGKNGQTGRFGSGYMTVYLALITGILLSLILAVLEAARVSTIRMHIECCADMALDSALAQYHREMLKQYDLFFIDTSYGTADPSFHRTEAQIQKYLDMNLRPQEEFQIPFAKDLTGLSADSVSLLRAGVATDDAGAVLKYHVVQYQKDIAGISLAEQILNRGQEAESWQNRDMESEWDAAEEALKGEIAQKKRLQDEAWDGEVPETPSDAVRATRGEGILGAAAQGMELSFAVIAGNTRPSVRSLNQGTGLMEPKEPPGGLLADGLLYAYILEKCGYFGKEKPNSALSYEVEYILQQETSDQENLKQTLQELLLFREAANAAFLFSSGLRAQAEEAAALIAAALLMPELTEGLTAVILFAWAYAESVKDIRILLKDGRVPLMKSEATWNTPFSQLLTYRSHLDSCKSTEQGWYYRDYLGALLFCHRADHAVQGLMDVMENDIRRTPGYQNFRMDGLIDGMETEISVTSRYGGNYQIRRIYEYE